MRNWTEYAKTNPVSTKCRLQTVDKVQNED